MLAGAVVAVVVVGPMGGSGRSGDVVVVADSVVVVVGASVVVVDVGASVVVDAGASVVVVVVMVGASVVVVVDASAVVVVDASVVVLAGTVVAVVVVVAGVLSLEPNASSEPPPHGVRWSAHLNVEFGWASTTAGFTVARKSSSQSNVALWFPFVTPVAPVTV